MPNSQYPRHIRKILEKTNVAILTPIFSTVDYRFVQSITNMVGHSVKNGMGYAGMAISHRSKTVSARNQLIKSIIEDKTITHCLLLDDDHTFKANLLCNLLSREKDFICAVATQKSPPYYPVIYRLSDNGKHSYHSFIAYPPAIFEIDGCGFGCVLIKKSIFDSMEHPWIEEKTGEYGHDLHFCSKLRDRGIKMFCDGTQEINHIGHTPDEFGPDDFRKYQPELLKKTRVYEEKRRKDGLV